MIQKPEAAPAHIPFDCIDSVILHTSSAVSVAAIDALLSHNVSVIFCNTKQEPAAMVFPFARHHLLAERITLQQAASQPLRKRLWQCIVATKVQRQSELLEQLVSSRALLNFHLRVRSGDPDNIEAQAARIYWKSLFGPTFHRGRYVDPVNSILNYGYAVLRAAMARAVASVGLHPVIGLHHRDARDNFALVDDLMEPYRPIVDRHAYDMAVILGQSLTPDCKATLAALPATDLRHESMRMPVRNCLVRTAYSLYESLRNKTPNLWYPEEFWVDS